MQFINIKCFEEVIHIKCKLILILLRLFLQSFPLALGLVLTGFLFATMSLRQGELTFVRVTWDTNLTEG